MLHTTFRMAREAGACSSEYNKMAKALGGIKKYGRDTPIPLDRVLEVCGLDAALWCLCCVIEPADREIRLFACDCAEHILPIYAKRYPGDTTFGAGEDAVVAAWDVARFAAWAARAVARDTALAAWDAENQWQEKKFREMLNK